MYINETTIVLQQSVWLKLYIIKLKNIFKLFLRYLNCNLSENVVFIRTPVNNYCFGIGLNWAAKRFTPQ